MSITINYRPLASALVVAATLAASVPALAQSQTIRIEPRPYYGAVVTIEQGVRVWRPLPPTSHMIINPTGAPVSLNVADVRETITSNNHFHGVPAAAAQGQGYAGAPAYYYGRPGAFAGNRLRPLNRPARGGVR